MNSLQPKFKNVVLEGELQCIDWLIYRSYEANRLNSPHVEPTRWRNLYLNQEIYEKIYQRTHHV